MIYNETINILLKDYNSKDYLIYKMMLFYRLFFFFINTNCTSLRNL